MPLERPMTPASRSKGFGTSLQGAQLLDQRGVVGHLDGAGVHVDACGLSALREPNRIVEKHFILPAVDEQRRQSERSAIQGRDSRVARVDA
jgi:hypothetical protein